MIFDMYLNEGLGTGKIARRLTELGRLNASGLNKWSHGVISRILNNQTYMGVIAYGKSFSNNYLEQKRINNHDKSTYIYMEGKFCHRQSGGLAQGAGNQGRPHDGKLLTPDRQTGSALRSGEQRPVGKQAAVPCGCGFRKMVAPLRGQAHLLRLQVLQHFNNGLPAAAGCRGRRYRYCDQPMIADWKLELMGKAILEQVFRDSGSDSVHHQSDPPKLSRTPRPWKTNMANLTARMERIKAKKETLLDMRTEGEITKEELFAWGKKLDAELQKMTVEQERLAQTNTIDLEQPEWGRIQDALEEILDLSQPKPSPDLIRKFVTQVVPIGKTNFCWH